MNAYNQGRPQDLVGGGQEFFFQIWKFAGRMRFARGVRGHAPPPRENFLKWCNFVRFNVYFDQILSLKNFKSYHFLYKRINILDTR